MSAMEHYELTEKFARMWRDLRRDAGWSQERVARGLGVSRTTVQNWENGIACPSQIMGFEYFKMVGLNPMPYYMKLFFADESEQDEQLNELLSSIASALPPEAKRKIIFWFTSANGSAMSVLDMAVAHLHTPLKDRIATASNILLSYKLSEAKGQLIHPEEIKPNTERIDKAIREAIKSVLSGNEDYTVI